MFLTYSGGDVHLFEVGVPKRVCSVIHPSVIEIVTWTGDDLRQKCEEKVNLGPVVKDIKEVV